jgi:hypothetical protein
MKSFEGSIDNGLGSDSKGNREQSNHPYAAP